MGGLMFQRRAWILFAGVCLAACTAADAGPGPDPDLDPMMPPDGEEVIDLETYLEENHVVRLTDDGDGVERGIGTSDSAGVVRFYSERHEAMVNFDVTEHTMASA